MPNPNRGEEIAAIWEQAMQETPDPRLSGWLFDQLCPEERRSYRERLDEQPRNWHGNLIPRIVTVRRNLRRLGNIRLDPKRLP